MHAYAALGKFNPNFADHDWAVKNLKEEDHPNDFSAIWAGVNSWRDLDTSDDAVYFYGGRDAIYKALAKFEDAVIRNHARGQGGRRDVPIHVFSAVVRTLGGRKQIIMLAAADARRDADLAAFRAQDLEEADTAYRMREFRQRMKQKWPDIG
jgi:hypothetical protein